MIFYLGVNLLRPLQYILLTYIQHLQTALSSPSTVMNYISGVRTWVLASDRIVSAFDRYLVKLMKHGVQRTSTHVPAQAPPLLPMDVQNAVCFYNSIDPNCHVLVAALLVGYFTLLSQSNLFYSYCADDPGHTLRVCRLTLTHDGLCICVRSSKISTKASKPTNIRLPAIPSSPYCPVSAWTN